MLQNHRRVGRVLVTVLSLCLTPFVPAALGAAPDGPLELKRGDHVAVIGNTLADRMQHHGWLETFVHARLPEHELVWRNLAVAGDEVMTRHRSENFGSPDEWLTKVGADVVLAFFGFNESFRGEAGLEKFKADLGKFLTDTAAKRYDGEHAPTVVLFSPIAAERHQDPNFPDPAPLNANLKLYAAAMAEVARAHGVRFVDLYTPSERLFAEAAARGRSLTINGLHLGEEGDRLLAGVIFKALFATEPADAAAVAKLRAAVLDKNANWHARYRTVDGYNVYGGRSKLAFPSGKGDGKITNYHVMQEEMTQRDVLTANRDRRVWAVARGSDLKVDDSNLPGVTDVPTNKPDAAPYVSGEAAIEKMKVSDGIKVNLFASEERFPELVNPVQMAWDTKGRLWVAAWRNYPSRRPTDAKGDSLLVLEDTDNDGRADKCTPFLDDLNCPTGFQFYKDGVLVMQAPDLVFVRDANGDGKGDQFERVLMGMDSADSHHTTNSICYEPGGAVYLSDGVFHRTQVETAAGPVRNVDGAIYRFEPRTGKFERYAAYGFANPHGRVFDRWGNDFITDATGNANYFGPAISGRIDHPGKHKSIKQFWNRPSRPSPGTAILTSRHFPDDWQGNFLNMNVIGFQGVYRVKIREEGSGLAGESLPDLIYSNDPNFRPTAINVGPDGAVYMADWHNAIIGHMQHHLRDPARDHAHGRVYRLTYEGRPLMKPVKIDGQPIPALLELLKEPEDQTRELAKIELDKHDTRQVVAAAKQWAASLKTDDPEYAHHLTEALWVHQWHDVVDVDLLKRVLASPDPRARTAATRVAGYWRERVPGVLAILKERAGDEHPRVRLEAVRSASFFPTDEAVDVALAAVRKPTDYYLDYVLGETLRQLQPQWHKALADGRPIAAGNPEGQRFLTRMSTVPDLLKLPRGPLVLETILTRGGVADADRLAALKDLGERQKTGEVATLLDVLERTAKAEPAAAVNVARLLPMMAPGELKAARQRLEPLAVAEGLPGGFQRYAWAALALADESFDAAWAQAARSPAAQAELLYAVPLLYDTDLRAKAFDKVMPLLAGRQDEQVRRAAIVAAVSIPAQQAAVTAALAELVRSRDGVGPAARGLRALPQSKWAKTHGAAVAGDLVAWAKTVPADRRTQPEYLDAVQLASELATALPADQVADLRRELKDLRVAVFAVNAVREQMRYDSTLLVVEAGKPFEILFENPDFMPHNLVVVKPGKRAEVGAAALKMKPDEFDRAGRAFIPSHPAVIGATKLLENGERASLKMNAPTAEGEYEYVCTYPGHWEVMWGRLIVTKDVDAYLRDARPAEAAAASGAAASSDHKQHGKK